MKHGTMVYLAHPVRPEAGETLEGNLAAAERWLRSLIEVDIPWDVICPWIAELRAWGTDLAQAERAQRDRGMARQRRIACRCDGILLVGPRVSPGMEAERDAVVASGGWALDATRFDVARTIQWLRAIAEKVGL